MSMSLFVVLALEVEPNSNDLNLFAKELEYNIEYSQGIELNKHSGFLPAKISGNEVGVELYSYSTSDLPEQIKSILTVEYEQGVVYQLSFGGKPSEAQTAFTTAILMTTKYNGVTIEDQSGTLLSVEQLTQALQYFSM